MVLMTIMAQCHDCDWEYDRGNAMAMASYHNKKYDHEVSVDLAYTHVFRRQNKGGKTNENSLL